MVVAGGSLLDAFGAWVQNVNSFLWGTLFLIPLLCGTGFFYTARLKFVQIRKFPLAVRYLCGGASLFGKRADKSGMSSFQALTTAIAAQVGTGNVAGTASAMALGGAGAIFWLWCAAFFGMATIFAEAVLAQVYKTTDSAGHVVGGPAYYITLGMGPKARPLAIFFAIALIIALGFIGNMVQANTIAAAFHRAFGLENWIVGICTSMLALLVFWGGMGRIAAVTEKMVPCMAMLYIAGGCYVLIVHADAIGSAFDGIFRSAFSPEAVYGGGIGITIATAMRYGVARGLFANEAGMGSTPHAHAVAKVAHPCHQGLVAIFGVFTTFVIITFTAMVILVSGVFAPGDGNPTGINLTQMAFAVDMGASGVIFVGICLFFFAFSTIIGWYFFGAQNVRYLFGERGVTPYRILVALFVLLGSLLEVKLVWELSDMFNALMALPNIIALWALNHIVAARLREFEKMEF